ncbi:MAG: hypothetical protein DIU52_002090 [bacterium]|jgi:hypothetical protein|nr:MAG: hypothetical protein DIU52_07935 [bacterium]
MRPRVGATAWRSFDRRDQRAIRARLAAGAPLRCPRCAGLLEARPTSRLLAVLPSGARGYDLDCRSCHQFLPLIEHTPQSLRLLRLRRLVAAVRRA